MSSTKHKNPGARVPRWKKDPSAIYRVMNKIQPFTAGELIALETPLMLSWEKLRTGSGASEDFHNLAAAVNLALVRSEAIDPECVAVCQLAQAALMRMIERHHRMGVWGVDGLGLQEIPPALDLFKQVIELGTPIQMAKAMDEVLVRMRRGDVYDGRAR